jgi:murein DD-endopeptidase MepM/ murein hydrolase activator NlpD
VNTDSEYQARRVAEPVGEAEARPSRAVRGRVSLRTLIANKLFTTAFVVLAAAVGIGSVAYLSTSLSGPAVAEVEPTVVEYTPPSTEELAAERAAIMQEDAQAVNEASVEIIAADRKAVLNADAEEVNQEATRIREISTFLWPTEGSVSKGNGFGMRYHPIYHYYRMHDGMDIGGECGQPIYAAQSGEVVKADSGGYNGGSGNNVRIDHGDINGVNVMTGYLHMDKIAVTVGQLVDKGEYIGTVGKTGLATGCHLHLSLYKDGKGSDPAEYVKPDPSQAPSDSDESSAPLD